MVLMSGIVRRVGVKMFTVSIIAFLSLTQISEDARLMRHPDIHENRIVFSYGGDLWVVTSEGGVARQLTRSPGNEMFPKFSPDGKQIAFSGQFEGNTEVYVMPSEGGEAKRLTTHPLGDAVLDWTPDGRNIIFRSARESKNGRYAEAFLISVEGGTPRNLNLGESGLASPSPDGRAYAYNRIPTESATWKRYRGGLQSYISFYEPGTNRYWEMKHDDSAYLWPMWVDHRVFYVNDSDGIRNLYNYDTNTQRSTKLTNFTELDISWPSYGTGKIVYVRDGKLWVYEIASQKISEVKVRILTDLPESRPRYMRLGGMIRDISLSPNSVRLAVEARGEVFSVPVKEGITRNVSQTSGARERYPRWSPDGKWILFASDKTGEYEFYVQRSDLSEPAEQVTFNSSKIFSAPKWSRDSKKFIYTDSSNSLYIVDLETRSRKLVGRAEYGGYSDAVWSYDSKWLAYTKYGSQGFGRIHLYEIATGKETVISDGMFDDSSPVFDASGKYLFFVSKRNISVSSDVFELMPVATNTDVILGWALTDDALSPFAPRDENEKIQEEKKEEAEKKDSPPQEKSWSLQKINERIFAAPLPPGSYSLVDAPQGRLIYVSIGGGLFGGMPTLNVLDFASRQPSTIISGFQAISFTPNYDKFAYLAGGTLGVVPMAPNQQPPAGRVNTSDMETIIVPRDEWKQSYWEAWRYVRDYFWSDNISGLDWKAIGERYARWLPYVAHRADLDQLLWELLADLGTGHAYLMGGANVFNRPASSPIGLLGADYEVTASGIRFKKIYRGHIWDSSRRAPLAEPGLNVKEGDYILAVDGVRVTASTSIDDLMIGKVDKVVELTINSVNTMTGARKILVRPTNDDLNLRYADWVDTNRKYVEERTGGRVAYVHVPDTAIGGVVEFWRMFYPQVDKDAMIIDERYNGGGFIPDFFIEKLSRKHLTYWKPRDGGSFRSPGAAMLGPKVMLINSYAGSGGDAFPYYFKKRGLGPLIGTRTWGGLIGIMGNRDLMADGAITVPQFAVWDVDEKGNSFWAVENIGVSPDMLVDNTPDKVAQGKDPQLDAAIDYLLDQLKKNPPKRPKEPPFPTGRGK